MSTIPKNITQYVEETKGLDGRTELFVLLELSDHEILGRSSEFSYIYEDVYDMSKDQCLESQAICGVKNCFGVFYGWCLVFW